MLCAQKTAEVPRRLLCVYILILMHEPAAFEPYNDDGNILSACLMSHIVANL